MLVVKAPGVQDPGGFAVRVTTWVYGSVGTRFSIDLRSTRDC